MDGIETVWFHKFPWKCWVCVFCFCLHVVFGSVSGQMDNQCLYLLSSFCVLGLCVHLKDLLSALLRGKGTQQETSGPKSKRQNVKFTKCSTLYPKCPLNMKCCVQALLVNYAADAAWLNPSTSVGYRSVCVCACACMPLFKQTIDLSWKIWTL